MAEIIQDIYQLSFDGGQFEKELASAIASVQKYEATLNDATASTEELAEAQEGLVGANKDLDKVLGQQVKTVDQLDSKQAALTKQQDNLNQSSTTYQKVAKENVKTQGQQAKAVATTTKNNKGFGKSLLSNVRNLNRVRSAARLLNGAFRVLAGVSIFGLASQILPAVISLFQRTKKETRGLSDETKNLNAVTESIGELYKEETQDLNNLFGALNNTNLSSQERSAVISEIQNQYGEYIGNINLETASQDELRQAYDAASAAILSQVVAKAKAARARELINKIIDREIQLQKELRNLEDGAAAILEDNAEAIGRVDKAVQDANPVFQNQIKTFEEQQKAYKDLTKAFAESDVDNAKRDIEELDEVFEQVEKRLQEELIGLLDPATLYGDFEAGTKKAASSVQVLEGSLSALQKELAALEKQQKEQTKATDAATLISIQEQIDAQKERIKTAKQLLADIRGIADAEANIERLKTEAIETETDKRIRLIKERAQKEIDVLVGSESQKLEQEKLIVEAARKEINAISEKAFQDAVAKADSEAQRFRQIQQDAANKEEATLVANQQRLLSIRLQELEKQRQEETSAAELTNEQIIEINKGFDAQRIEAEKETQREILQIQIQAQQKRVAALSKAGKDTIEAEEELEKLKLQLIELDKTDVEVEIKTDTDDAKKSLKELVNEIADIVSEVSDAVFNLVGQQAAFLTQRLDEAVQRSQSALDNIRQNSEDFNADQLEIEKKRLADLEEERARAARREQVIAQIQVATQSAIAIARAAAEGGIAAPFTIAATIASLIAGFAAARNASSGAFYHGTEYLERGGAPVGRDTIHIRAHEGERIVPTVNNMKYWDAYSAMQNEKIPAPVANMFAQGYLKGGLQGAVGSLQGAKTVDVGRDISLSEKVGLTNYFVQQATDFSNLEKRLEGVEQAIRTLPQKMPVASFRADKKGFSTFIKNYQSKMQSRKDRAK